MVFFSLDCVLRGFSTTAYIKYASSQTLVRPCPAKKIHIYESDAEMALHDIGRALDNNPKTNESV
jgi:hypothetical protein